MVAAPLINAFKPAFRQGGVIVLTRSIRAPRRQNRRQRRGTERAGLVASSSAHRLKPHAIEIRVDIDPLHWFLSPAKDSRLSLDHTPSTHSFRGAKWTDVKTPERRQYLKNAYRVLLTQARRGMVIFDPPGARRDKTRSPGFYDGVYENLAELGMEPANSANGQQPSRQQRPKCLPPLRPYSDLGALGIG